MGRLQKEAETIPDCFSHLYTRRSYYRRAAFSSFPYEGYGPFYSSQYEDYGPYHSHLMDGSIRIGVQLLESLEMPALREAVFPKMVVSQFIREKMCSLQATEVGISESGYIMDAKIESAKGPRVRLRRRIKNNAFDSDRHSRRGK